MSLQPGSQRGCSQACSAAAPHASGLRVQGGAKADTSALEAKLAEMQAQMARIEALLQAALNK